MADFLIISQPTAVWDANNPTLQANELGVCSDLRDGVETDTGIARLGNGVDSWNDLPNFNPTNSSQVLFSYLAETVTYNDTAALADTPLSVTVAAGGIYAIEAYVYTANVANPLTVDFGGTSTQTNFNGEWAAMIDGLLEVIIVTTTGLDVSFAGAAFTYVQHFTGSVEVNAGGTFLLRGAQSSAVASDTTILRGSTLTLTKRN